MTAIALRDASNDVAVSQPTNLAQWAEEARQAANVAVSLAKTPFVPASLRDRDPGVTAANITAAILTGQELGLEPMAALRSIDVIQGTPALRAIALRAVVLAAGHELWVAESTQTRAIVRGKRRGTEQVQESVWTLDRAKQLNLTGKDNWRKQPGAMLIARATAECSRLIAADALLGVPYVAEELADGDDAQVVPSDAGPAPERRTARRRSAQPPATVRPPVEREQRDPEPEPDFGDGLDEFHPDTTSNPSGITEPQMKWLQAHYKDVDRDIRLADASQRLDITVESFSSLSKDDASRLIDQLDSGELPMDPA